jgi:very-short-patch-repair endonuclease
MGRRLKYEEVKSYIEENSDCKLISKEYKGVNYDIELLCGCREHTFITTFKRFRYGVTKCGFCKGKVNWSYDLVKKEFEKRGYKLLTKSYKNNKQLLEYICSKHKSKGVLKINLHDLMDGHGCRYCGYEKMVSKQKLNYKFVKKEFEKAGYLLISTEYTSNSDKLKYICKKHPDEIQEGTYNNLKNYGNICRYCRYEKSAKSNRKSHEEFKKEVFHLVGKEYDIRSRYINSDTKVLIKHNACGYEWWKRPADFIRGDRCPNCCPVRESKLSKRIEKWLTKNLIQYEKEYRFKDCKLLKPLAFDFFLEKQNIIIEADGQHHFEPRRFGGISKERAIKEHNLTIKRDKIKNDYCNQKNIKLIRIPYWKYEEVEEILNKVIPR